MRRLLLAAALLAPLSAQAQDAFCQGLRQIVQAAAQDFVELPSGTHYLRGSVSERRGVAPPFDGAPPRAVYYAVMLRDDSPRAFTLAEQHMRNLQGEINRCLPQAQASAVTSNDRGSYQTWTMERAVVGLRREDSRGFASSTEIVVSIMSRW
ncbi:hypothetical protein KTR66_12345 [Roseococcus sp. SDR]|uniref:hypothetical protein n=1 Tax=Roseococcus sp. SDR TaxID=2835532 RepID=UPI001BCB16CD|nr:hypothetical protein [Roseococcus sp. SDR]MBS7790792.1 hypothetical protein [Roseococcus sp. SDR]MBV1846106.1 hypothetical protein [Roseococcus sp. SDR]